MTINVVNKEKALLAFLDNDLASLGIKDYAREAVVEAIKRGDPKLAIEGQQVFYAKNQLQFVDYNLYLKQYIPPNIYHPVTMFVRVTDEPHKFRMFQLSGDSYFTLPQAVNLLTGRPVCKPELVDRSIKDIWFHLDQRCKGYLWELGYFEESL